MNQVDDFNFTESVAYPDSGDNELKIFLPKSEIGLIIVPSQRLFIPMHNSMVQNQHAVVLDRDMSMDGLALPASVKEQIKANVASSSPDEQHVSAVICGFSPRAQHVCVSPNEEERPVDPKRLAALNEALPLVTDVTPARLTSAEYAGTPPARIYRSFVSPRPNAVLIVEPVERVSEATFRNDLFLTA